MCLAATHTHTQTERHIYAHLHCAPSERTLVPRHARVPICHVTREYAHAPVFDYICKASMCLGHRCHVEKCVCGSVCLCACVKIRLPLQQPFAPKMFVCTRASAYLVFVDGNVDGVSVSSLDYNGRCGTPVKLAINYAHHERGKLAYMYVLYVEKVDLHI